MKKLLALIVAPALVGALSLDTAAQTAQPAPADRPMSDRPTIDRNAPGRPAADRPATDRAADRARTSDDNRPVWQNTGNLHASSDLIGTKVKDAQGKDLGEIDQLLIDPKDGKVSHVVIGLGGMLGLGEKHVVVPFSDIKFGAQHEGNKAVITMDRAALDRAPRYDKRTAKDRTSPAASPSTSIKSEPSKSSDTSRSSELPKDPMKSDAGKADTGKVDTGSPSGSSRSDTKY